MLFRSCPEDLRERPKAKILLALQTKIQEGFDLGDLSELRMKDYDELPEDKKTTIDQKIREKIQAGFGLSTIKFCPDELPGYEKLSELTKLTIQLHIQRKIQSELDQIIEDNLPNSYEDNLRSPLREQNSRLRRMIAELKVENFRLKKLLRPK